MGSLEQTDGAWTLLTGHGHVLVEIARSPEARIRDISQVVGLTERTVQAIVADLAAAGYLTRDRAGRRNVYTVNPDMLFRHPAQEGHRVGPFLDLLAASGDSAESAALSSSQPEEPAAAFHRDRHEYGGAPNRLSEDQLARLTEEERVEAGFEDYDPDDVPPANE
jgi:DNA-binding MarR family transcriptional regulator